MYRMCICKKYSYYILILIHLYSVEFCPRLWTIHCCPALAFPLPQTPARGNSTTKTRSSLRPSPQPILLTSSSNLQPQHFALLSPPTRPHIGNLRGSSVQRSPPAASPHRDSTILARPSLLRPSTLPFPSSATTELCSSVANKPFRSASSQELYGRVLSLLFSSLSRLSSAARGPPNRSRPSVP